ncbi:MAG: NTE family protein [Verrucomicrobiales bacterium]|jgi:NTE family protein
MSEPNQDKHAVVLSGGGANGAYEIGVLKALVTGQCPSTNGQPLDPDVFLGTSVGAFNAAFLVSQWDQYGASSVNNLENIWVNEFCSNFPKRSNGIFHIRGNLLPYMNPMSWFPNPFRPAYGAAKDIGSLTWDSVQRVVNLVADQDATFLERVVNLVNFSSFISTSPLKRHVEKKIDYSGIRSSSKQLKIAATNWAQGRADIFENRAMTDKLGPQAILASTAIPGVFPVQKVGAEPFVDGGVLMNSPLMPAIESGANVIHVLTLNPPVNKIPLSTMSNTMTTQWRQQVIAWVKSVENDMKRARNINMTLELGSLAVDELSDKSKVAKSIKKFRQNKTPLTVYLYRPNDDLGGPLGLLNFDEKRVKMLIERGFQDTKNYRPEEDNFVSAKPIREPESEA